MIAGHRRVHGQRPGGTEKTRYADRPHLNPRNAISAFDGEVGNAET